MDPLEVLLVNVFSGTLGSPLAMGMVALLFFIILGVALRLSTTAFLIILFPLVFMFAGAAGLLPQSVLYMLIIGCAYIIYMAVMVVLRR